MYARASVDLYDDSVAIVKLIPIEKNVVAISMCWSTVVLIAQVISVGASKCICCCYDCLSLE